jgi:hypothetical protein
MTAEARRDLSLITSIIAGPVALLTNLEVSFALVPWVCANRWQPALHIVNVVFLLIPAATGWLAWSYWQESGCEWPDEGSAAPSRTRFMAVIGLVTSIICLLQILGMIINTLILGACQ